MPTDQFAVLVVLVLAANLALLGGLVGWRLRSGGERAPLARLTGLTGLRQDNQLGVGARGVDDPGIEGQATDPAPVATVPDALYERVVRVVAYLFIAATLVVLTVTGARDLSAVYLLLAAGAFLIVVGQDVLRLGRLGKWRFAVEALVAAVFISLLVLLTGGYQSPFLFGYLLLLAGASLWARGLGPFLLSLLIGGAYVGAVMLATPPLPATPEAVGRVAFNLVALALIAYVGSVAGRQQREAREAALRLSRFDGLTGLHSRTYAMGIMQQEVLRAHRSGRPFGFLMIDLDGLKAANDRFGHESGDRLLRAVAQVIHRGIRVTDIAARYGGDEFVVVLPETDLTGALRVAEKVRIDISRLSLQHDGGVLRGSASIGLVTFPEDGRTTAELMRRADLAMYEAKRRGRDQIVRYARGPLERVAVPIDESPDRFADASPSADTTDGAGTMAGTSGNAGSPSTAGRAGAPGTVDRGADSRPAQHAPWETEPD